MPVDKLNRQAFSNKFGCSQNGFQRAEHEIIGLASGGKKSTGTEQVSHDDRQQSRWHEKADRKSLAKQSRALLNDQKNTSFCSEDRGAQPKPKRKGQRKVSSEDCMIVGDNQNDYDRVISNKKDMTDQLGHLDHLMSIPKISNRADDRPQHNARFEGNRRGRRHDAGRNGRQHRHGREPENGGSNSRSESRAACQPVVEKKKPRLLDFLNENDMPLVIVDYKAPVPGRPALTEKPQKADEQRD